MKHRSSHITFYLAINLLLISVLLVGVVYGQVPFDTTIRLPSLLLILVIINTVLLFSKALFFGHKTHCDDACSCKVSRELRIEKLRAALSSQPQNIEPAKFLTDILGVLTNVGEQSASALYILDESGTFNKIASCGILPSQLELARFILRQGELILRHPSNLGEESLCHWKIPPRVLRHISNITILEFELLPLNVKTDNAAFLIALRKPHCRYISEIVDPETIGIFLEAAFLKQNSLQLLSERQIFDLETGLERFERFKEAFEIELERAERYNQNLTLLLVNITPCEQLPANQRESLRKAAATALKDSLRRLDTAFATEKPCKFAAILTEADSEIALRVTERIRQAFSARIADFNSLNPQLFVGTANYPSDASHGNTLLEMAEEALTEATKSGRPMVSYGSLKSGGAK